MTTHLRSWVFGVVPALSIVGCVSDFSPDPYKGNQNTITLGDGAVVSVTDAGGGGRSDASAPTDTGTPTPARDGGSDPLPSEGGGPVPSAGPCDLSGRWVGSERLQSQAYGAQQVNKSQMYYEIEQTGDKFTVKKSLLCFTSTDSAPGELFEVHMSDMPSWPAYQRDTNYNGRTGTSKAGGQGCDVSFDQAGLIKGVTPGAYTDPSTDLPTLAQKGEGATPGWVDIDNDGNPGLSMVVVGVANGTFYTAVRNFNTYTGSVAANAQSFQLDMDWMQDRIVYGTKDPDPLGILSSPAQRNPAAGLNLVEFARLSADQATGSDDAICDAIRTLAPTLNPAANK